MTFKNKMALFCA